MVGFWAILVKQMQEFQESSWDDGIDHFVARTSSEWRVIRIAWQNTDIAKEADLRRG